MTARKLRALCARYADKLELSQWSISLTFMPSAELAAKHVAGSSTWEPEYNVASIEVASDLGSDADIEETLIHELLHLKLEGHKVLTRGYKYDPLYERALNVLARVLVAPKARRRKS